MLELIFHFLCHLLEKRKGSHWLTFFLLIPLCIRNKFSGSYLWMMVPMPVLSLDFYSPQNHELTFFPFLAFSVLPWSSLATRLSMLPMRGIKMM